MTIRQLGLKTGSIRKDFGCPGGQYFGFGDGVHKIVYGSAHIEIDETRNDGADKDDERIAHEEFQRFHLGFLVEELDFREFNETKQDRRDN